MFGCVFAELVHGKKGEPCCQAASVAWRHGSFCCFCGGGIVPCPDLCVGWDAVRGEGPVVCCGLAGESAHVEVACFEESGAGVAQV